MNQQRTELARKISSGNEVCIEGIWVIIYRLLFFVVHSKKESSFVFTWQSNEAMLYKLPSAMS